MRVFLVGFMGCGKSSNARKLARVLQYRFIDTDKLIASLNEMRVNEIFEKQGDEYFRNEETKALHEICKMDDIVVATGGGMPCFNDNMKFMNDNGVTVYLEASAGLLYHRLVKNKAKRPLIANIPDDQLLEFIVQRVKERRDFYKQAQIVYKSENLDVLKLKERILEHVNSKSA
jgi:shikimate kinase